MKLSNKEQVVFENLSALFDNELSSTERDIVLDRLLGDPDLMKRWQRHQLTHDALSGQLHEPLLKNNLLLRVSQALQHEPAHVTESPVSQETVLPANSNTSILDHSGHADRRLMKAGWFSQVISNKLMAGTSVAVSVMFATLFTVQYFQHNKHESVAALATTNSAQTSLAQSTQLQSALVQSALVQSDLVQSRVRINNYAVNSLPAVLSLPANLVSTRNTPASQYTPMTGKSEKFIWIKAEPELSQQIQAYAREHESHSTLSSFNSTLTPKIRAASYHPINKQAEQ